MAKRKLFSKKELLGLRRFILNVKLRMPEGISLSDNEAGLVIDSWQRERSLVSRKQSDLEEISADIEDRMSEMPTEIRDNAKKLREAKATYKRTKDPVLKRKWAKRLVLLHAYQVYLRNSRQTLEATVERVKDAVEDAQVVNNLIRNRIADANIYRQLNGGLRLVGKALIEARTKHTLPDVEYQKLEFTLEQLDKELGNMPNKVLEEADRVVKELDTKS